MEPISIYKYREFNQYGWDIVKKHKVFFSSPKSFNDPRDCRVPILAERGTKKQMYNKTLGFLKERYPQLSRRERKQNAKMQAEVMYSRRNDEARKQEYRKSIYETTEDVGIFSASEINNNKLLWSHYSGGHTGFCVKLNTDKLVGSVLKYLLQGCIPIFKSVEYLDNIPSINPYKMTDEEIFMNIFFTKSLDWAHEREYRIMVFEKPNTLYTLLPNSIEHIYLGSECSIENQCEMIKTIKELPYNIKLSKVFYDELNYDIYFEQVNL